MYVCDYRDGVRVYDLRIPGKPELVDWEFEPYFELVPETLLLKYSNYFYKICI